MKLQCEIRRNVADARERGIVRVDLDLLLPRSTRPSLPNLGNVSVARAQPAKELGDASRRPHKLNWATARKCGRPCVAPLSRPCKRVGQRHTSPSSSPLFGRGESRSERRRPGSPRAMSPLSP
ncbi:hypothetical protein Salat_0844900 [Sesamum alatum]|uniref:Uncharacterized protein n=1 Tax=Sesamum alatum TaxID=300844 RepID=A0AAE2CQJ6_9LAMI|nr:hypothetical protein Salat_0844900 [Sesamum alatum]